MGDGIQTLSDGYAQVNADRILLEDQNKVPYLVFQNDDGQWATRRFEECTKDAIFSDEGTFFDNSSVEYDFALQCANSLTRLTGETYMPFWLNVPVDGRIVAQNPITAEYSITNLIPDDNVQVVRVADFNGCKEGDVISPEPFQVPSIQYAESCVGILEKKNQTGYSFVLLQSGMFLIRTKYKIVAMP